MPYQLNSIIESTKLDQYDTRDVIAHQQCDYWQDAISQTFVPLNCNILKSESFFGALSTKMLGNISLIEIKGSAQHIERNNEIMKHSDDGQILISFILDGEMGIQHHGREEYVGKGQFIFYDTYKPYNLYLNDPFEQIVLVIPREKFQRSLGNPNHLCSYTFGSKHPLKSLLFNYSKDLLKLSEDTTKNTQKIVLNKFFELLTYVALDEIKFSSNKSSNSNLLLEIKNLILQNLDRSDLNIHDIAYNFHISPRYVSKLFQQEEMTFTQYILQNRLKLSQRILSQTHSNTHKINQIAYQCGFNDISNFCKEFKKYYGVSPSEFRKLCI